MTKRMLIDATHAEETRVVVLDGSRLEDYDVEAATRKQLKGNIYLAKVVRVEPSLQAAFVEYGGNRHGFLAFAEIHPDYYQIPIADRQKLLAMQEAEARAAEEAEEAAAEAGAAWPVEAASGDDGIEAGDLAFGNAASEVPDTRAELPEAAPDAVPPSAEAAGEPPDPAEIIDSGPLESDPLTEAPPPETVGGDAETAEELRPPRIPPQFLRQYKIQEVIHRRQILLVQVVKEERGAKGAALTTYISLAGRYCVLMPNSPRGGGVSRKITSPADRRRLKEISTELAVPSGMGLIVRTAGANRPKPEIRRDCEYLLRLWDQIRDTVMNSVAPSLIYEEASLIKRAIRDVYSRDVEELLVDGEQGWHAAREFMRTLMPTHARKVQLWKDPAGRSLFSHERVEAELDRILSPTVSLHSGGSLVINQAEALVAIDVNSGRATRERNIEETALRTNLEAAEEAARQLRLRDLAGLIVIDFIDMEARKHNAMVERRLKEALKSDRARVQIGHISHFGLLEMSRQRLRPSLTETSFSVCPECGGTGHVRSTESAAIHLLRMLEDEASHRGGELRVHSASAVALYILNHKRAWLSEIEARHGVSVGFAVNDAEPLAAMRIERVRGAPAGTQAGTQAGTPAAAPVGTPVGEPRAAAEAQAALAAPAGHGDETASSAAMPAEADRPAAAAAPAVPGSEASDEAEDGERRRRRRRRRRRHHDESQPVPAEALPPELADQPEVAQAANGQDHDPMRAPRAGRPERSRRGIRHAGRNGEPRRESGRSRSADQPAALSSHPASHPAPQPDFGFPGGPAPVGPTIVGPTIVGPTPANPFADAALDLFDAIEAAAEQAAPLPRPPRLEPAPPALDLVPPPADPARSEPPHPESPPTDDRPPAPAVKPIVLGTDDDAQTEKKRGWWKR